MKALILVAAPMIALFAAPMALARQNPEPPPSGIVVHLFGQNSILSNVLPVKPGSAPGTTAGTAATAPGTTAGTAAGTPAEGAENDEMPSAGDVLHQMFVTGDPNNPSRPAAGKGSSR